MLPVAGAARPLRQAPAAVAPGTGVAFRRMGALKIAAATLLVGLAGVGGGTASAAPGFLGRGHDPGVAVDGAGTAHVAWLAEAGDAGTLEYCQVPRGKRACSLRRSIPLAEDGFGKVQVLLPRPGTVQIVAPLLRPAALVSSFDGGNTFAVATIGQDTPAIEQAIYGPGDFISLMSGLRPGVVRPLQLRRQRSDGPARAVRLGHREPGDLARAVGRRLRRVLLRPAGALDARGTASATRTCPRAGSRGRAWAPPTSPSAVGGRSGTWVAYVRRGA